MAGGPEVFFSCQQSSPSMMQVLIVAVGGAAGSVLRYGFQKALNTQFPAGTLCVNIAGCFLIGWLWAISLKGLNDEMRLLLMTGFCGGFTTFSAFTLESVQLMMNGRWMAFSAYTTSSLVCGILATYFGFKFFS
jgi:CrcB protein